MIRTARLLVWFSLGLAPCLGGEVWHSTFDIDGDTDGVVDVQDHDPNFAMIGPVAGGFLTITTRDVSFASPFAFIPEKAGRPLDAPRSRPDSFSGLYRFHWTDLWGDPVAQDSLQAFEFAGFLGDNAIPQTRQVIGVILIHWQIANGDFYIWLGTMVGGSGDQVIEFSFDGPTNLGPNAEGTDYQLAIGWDGTSDTVQAILYDAAGQYITGHTKTIVNPPPFVFDFQVTHLGWSDYTGNGQLPDKPNVWAVDELIFYDAFDDAFNAVVGIPGDLDGDGDVDLADLSRLLADFGCTPPPTCDADIDGDGDTDLSDLSILLTNFGR